MTVTEGDPRRHLRLDRLSPRADSPAAEQLNRLIADGADIASTEPIRSVTDCLIAAVAIRSDVALLHGDRDFVLLAEVSPLRLCPTE